MGDRIGQQLGNYRVTHKLGEGGFAEVYLGEHIHLGTQAAIKVLRAQLTSDDADKFRLEARTIAHLVHPNIVRVLEFGLEGSTPFLVMDYAPNGTLRQRHPRGTQLPLTTIVEYVKQAASAFCPTLFPWLCCRSCFLSTTPYSIVKGSLNVIIFQSKAYPFSLTKPWTFPPKSGIIDFDEKRA